MVQGGLPCLATYKGGFAHCKPLIAFCVFYFAPYIGRVYRVLPRAGGLALYGAPRALMLRCNIAHRRILVVADSLQICAQKSARRGF